MKIPGHDIQVPKFDFAAMAKNVKETKERVEGTLPARDEVELYWKSKAAPFLTPLMSSAIYGKSMGVDNSTTAPHRFGYGTLKQTLFEVDSSSRERSGARLRLFGDASRETISASLGLEGEAGLKGSGRDEAREESSVAFLGLRGRAFGEAGLLGASTGGEFFLGGDLYSQEGDEHGRESWTVSRQEFSLGVRGAAIASVNVFGASEELFIQAGAEVRAETQSNFQIAGPVGVMNTVDVFAFVGARAAAGAGVGYTGFGAHAEAFAGLKAGVEERLALSVEGAELIGGAGRVELWAGAGAKAELKAGYDPKTDEVGVSGSAGAAVGVGASLSGSLTMSGAGIANAAHDGFTGTSVSSMLRV